MSMEQYPVYPVTVDSFDPSCHAAVGTAAQAAEALEILWRHGPKPTAPFRTALPTQPVAPFGLQLIAFAGAARRAVDRELATVSYSEPQRLTVTGWFLETAASAPTAA